MFIRLIVAVCLTVSTSHLSADSLYLSNQSSKKLTQLDLDNGSIKHQITLPAQPVSIGIDHQRHWIYVTHPEQSSVSIINQTTNEFAGTIKTGGQPFAIAVDEGNAAQVFISDWQRNAIIVINPKSKLVVDILAVGNSPSGISLDSQRRRLYVANRNSDSLTVLDADTPRKYAEVATGKAPYAVTHSHDGEYIYVTAIKDNLINVIDAKSFKVVKTISTGIAPYGIAISADDKLLAVANQGSNNIGLYDAKTSAKLADISVGTMPESVVISPDKQFLYVSNWFNNTVSVVNLDSHQVVKEIEVSDGPRMFSQYID